MIHATLSDGTTMLFNPYEKVWTADWVSDDGEYFVGEHHGHAKDLIIPDVYVIERNEEGPYIEKNAKIIRVREVPDFPKKLK